MSRESKTFYIEDTPTGDITDNINTQLAGEVLQEGDIAIVNGFVDPITTNTTTHRSSNEVFQLNKTGVDVNNAPVLEWESQRESNYTDSIIANITSIRKVHIAELRNFINFMQNIYVRKYGDKYFNLHDFTNAIMLWDKSGEGEKFKAYMAKDITTSNENVLHFEIESDSASDKIRYVRRAVGVADTVSKLVDIAGNEFRSYVAAYFELSVNITGATVIGSTLNVAGITTLSSDLNVGGALTVTGATELGAVKIKNKLDLGTLGNAYIQTGTANSKTTIEVALTGENVDSVNFIVPDDNALKTNGHKVMNSGNGGHGSTFDADTLDGYHATDFLTAADLPDDLIYNPVIETFITPGTSEYTVPVGISGFQCKVFLLGAGGGGGAGAGSTAPNSDPTASGGGGGAGKTLVGEFTVSTGDTIDITVGAAGSGGTNSLGGSYGYAGSGTSGGNSIVSVTSGASSGSVFTANGGAGGTGAGIINGSPSAGSGGLDGGSAGKVNWGQTYCAGGSGGSISPFGAGGSDSASASGYGAGGGGGGSQASGGKAGGNGSGGYIKLEIFNNNAKITVEKYKQLITWLDTVLATVPDNAR